MLINCARGGIVDEEALYEAIVAGKVGGAALDVFDPEESTSRRNVLGGTGLEAVQAQLQQAKKLLEDPQQV
jgi:phosphoglycerate dehydrogenase-like enzyme